MDGLAGCLVLFCARRQSSLRSGEPSSRGAGSIFSQLLTATSTVSACQRLFGWADCLLLIPLPRSLTGNKHCLCNPHIHTQFAKCISNGRIAQLLWNLSPRHRSPAAKCSRRRWWTSLGDGRCKSGTNEAKCLPSRHRKENRPYSHLERNSNSYY